ncbi:MAG: phosphatase PAP2 family protein [Actinomycetes bacterium]
MSAHTAVPKFDRPTLIEPGLSERSEFRWKPFAAVALGGWIAMLAVCVGAGWLITGALSDSGLVRWDRQYPVDLAATRTATGRMWSHYGSLMGETLTVIAVAVLVGVALLLLKRWASVLLIATALLSEVTIFIATTLLVPRDRPDVHQLDASPPTSSFPSGHTAASTALAFSLAVIIGWHVRSRIVRLLAWVVAVVIGPVVGFCRIYRGMHHPLDVAVGFALGAGCVLVAFLAVRTWAGEASHAVEQGDADDRPEQWDSSSDSRMAS